MFCAATIAASACGNFGLTATRPVFRAGPIVCRLVGRHRNPNDGGLDHLGVL